MGYAAASGAEFSLLSRADSWGVPGTLPSRADRWGGGGGSTEDSDRSDLTGVTAVTQVRFLPLSLAPWINST